MNGSGTLRLMDEDVDLKTEQAAPPKRGGSTVRRHGPAIFGVVLLVVGLGALGVIAGSRQTSQPPPAISTTSSSWVTCPAGKLPHNEELKCLEQLRQQNGGFPTTSTTATP